METMSRLYAFYVSLCEQYGNGFISLEEISGHVSEAQNHLFHYYMDRLPEREAEEALRGFRRETPPITAGRITLPTDYQERIAMVYSTNGTNLRNVIVANERQAEALSGNSLRSHNIYALPDAHGYSIYPLGTIVSGLQLRYYARPADVVFGGVKQRGEMIINDTPTPLLIIGGTLLPESVLPSFAPAYWPRLVHRALEFAGIKLSDSDLYSVAAKMQAEEEAR